MYKQLTIIASTILSLIGLPFQLASLALRGMSLIVDLPAYLAARV